MFPDDHPVVVDDMNKRLEKNASVDLPQILLTSRFHGQTLHFFHLFPVTLLYPVSLIFWLKLCIFHATKSPKAASTMDLQALEDDGDGQGGPI